MFRLKTSTSIFHPLEVVGQGSETQFNGGGNLSLEIMFFRKSAIIQCERRAEKNNNALP